MSNQIYSKSLKATFVFFYAIVLTACGGGSSDSGGPSAPIGPAFTLFTVGLYNGNLNLTLDGENVEDSSSEPTPLVIEVQGGVAGSQQVRVAFAQFSGTSAIGPDGEFNIPSGIFPLRVTDGNNQVIDTCNGELLFEGVFAGAAVSGNVSTTTLFTCTQSRFGPITLAGTFEATQGAAKLTGFERDISVRALGL